MHKVCSPLNFYSPIKVMGGCVIISYDLQLAPNNLYTWYEIYFYKRQKNSLSFLEVKNAIFEDINSQTESKITSGLVWNNKPVWLNKENQFNFSEGERKAKDDPSILPITYKIGLNENEEPVYHTFTTVEEIINFYNTCFVYINQCLNEGWLRKDSIDWVPYEEALEEI